MQPENIKFIPQYYSNAEFELVLRLCNRMAADIDKEIIKGLIGIPKAISPIVKLPQKTIIDKLNNI